MNDRSFLLTLPGIGRLLAQNGETLDIEPLAGTDPADALPFAMGTGFGALLYQRGGVVLHAAAVTAPNGDGIAICAPSGFGKSSLAAALCHCGCRFVSDDVTAVELNPAGEPTVWPDGRSLKLSDSVIERLDLGDARRSEVRSGVGKHYVDVPPASGDRPVRLSAIYILRDRHGPKGFERAAPLMTAQILLNQAYRRRLALATASNGAQLAVTAAILEHVPVFILNRRRNLDRLPDSAADLLAHWSEHCR